MKTVFFSAVLSMIFLISSLAKSQVEVGNGGDVVTCIASADNSYNGTYVLDFLLAQSDSDVAITPTPFERVSEILAATHFFFDSFDLFRADYLAFQNGSETAFYKWTARHLGEINIEDEQISSKIPENCKTNGKVNIRQAAVREFKESHVILYYDPDIWPLLDGLQKSFLLIHEYLWLYSHSAAITRDANVFLHSHRAGELHPNDVEAELVMMGLNVHEMPRYVNHEVVIRPGFKSNITEVVDFRPNRFTQNRLLISNFTEETLLFEGAGVTPNWYIAPGDIYTVAIEARPDRPFWIRPFEDGSPSQPVAIEVKVPGQLP